MKRYFLQLAYDGSKFFGWQIQPEQISVQETIEKCLSKLHSNEEVKITGCGRTDTGVHAHDYFAHVDLPETNTEQLTFKLNKMLPDSIAIKSVFEVEPEKHARFDASERVYRYFVHTKKDPFLANRSLLVNHSLNFDAMNKAAKKMIGKKDFTSFSKLHTDVKTNICDVRSAKWVQETESTYYFEIRADRFLRNMVRATVGTLLDVGMGKLQVEDIDGILADMDRQAASKSADAHGLFLWEIKY
ncbi:MAG: tRNA pseudouridine(38-40) synthase TruA [Crocinitomicaceae bacterium]